MTRITLLNIVVMRLANVGAGAGAGTGAIRGGRDWVVNGIGGAV